MVHLQQTGGVGCFASVWYELGKWTIRLLLFMRSEQTLMLSITNSGLFLISNSTSLLFESMDGCSALSNGSPRFPRLVLQRRIHEVKKQS